MPTSLPGWSIPGAIQTPWVDTRYYSSLDSAVAAATSAGTGLVISTSVTLDGSKTFSIPITMPYGGELVKASTYTVTFNDVFEAGPYSVFSGFSAGDVTFNTSSVHEVCPEWFGAVGDAVYSTGAGTDDTTAVQSALDSFSKVKFLGRGYKFNVTLNPYNEIAGSGQGKTVFIPAVDASVFSVSTTQSTAQINLHDFFLNGTATKATFTSADGINLSPGATGTFVDPVEISRVSIYHMGRYGLRAVGKSDSGPHVQRLHVSSCNFQYNANAGLSLKGAIFEASVKDSFITDNGGTSASLNNSELLLNTEVDTIAPKRVLFLNVAMNATSALSAGTPHPALYIEHASNVNILSGDFENADPAIKLAGSLLSNVSIIGNNFSSTVAVDKVIWIEDCNGLTVDNNRFLFSAAASKGVYSGSAASRAKMIKVTNTNYFNAQVNYPYQHLGRSQTLTSGGNLFAYLEFMFMDTYGAAASQNLVNIWGPIGSANRTGLVDGQDVVLGINNAAHDIVVKHGTGNIITKTGSDVTLGEKNVYIHLQWSLTDQLWIEI